MQLTQARFGHKPMLREFFERYVEPLTKWAMAIILFAMMVLGVADVLGRYFLNRPVFGATEMAAFGLGLLVFTALPVISYRGEHITVNLLQLKQDSLVERIRNAVMKAISVGVLLFLALELGGNAADYLHYGDTSSGLHIPFGPVAAYMSGFATLAAFCLLISRWKSEDSDGERGA